MIADLIVQECDATEDQSLNQCRVQKIQPPSITMEVCYLYYWIINSQEAYTFHPALAKV